jgi:hypothetical protein
MRAALLIVLLILTIGFEACQTAKSATSASTARAFSTSTSASSSKKIDFDHDIKPILQRCQPCHFQGGKVYDRMPFDKAETVTRLGTELFTRIKDEKEQQLIRDFLAQP